MLNNSIMNIKVCGLLLITAVTLHCYAPAKNLMAAGTSLAEDVLKCPAETVPIKIIREREPGYVTTLYEANISDQPPGFAAFVTAVTEHLAVRLAQEGLCLNNTESKEQSLLQFLPRRVFMESRPFPSATPIESDSPDVCRISSPWLELAVERKPTPRVRGIIRYSERQLLTDQAVLAGARDVQPGIAEPLAGREFDRYASEYAKSEIPRSKPADKPLEERVPPDLLWLFRRAPQSTFIPFSTEADSTMKGAMKGGAAGYTKVIITLIDHCLASDGANIRYSYILDLADLIQLEQLMIGQPIR